MSIFGKSNFSISSSRRRKANVKIAKNTAINLSPRNGSNNGSRNKKNTNISTKAWVFSRRLFSLKISSEEDLKNTERRSINNDNGIILNRESNTNDINHSNFSDVDDTKVSIKREDPKIGRNELVKISNGKDTKEIKYKKAQALIDSGEWKIV